MRKQKLVTNEMKIKNLLKDLSSIETALLTERLQTISKITKNDIAKNPEQWANCFVHPNLFLLLCDKIDKHLA